MVENRFRAWDKKLGYYEDEENIFINQNGGIYRADTAEWYDSRYKIEWFTGMYDKKKNRIYDGDLILADWHGCSCKWTVYCNSETKYWNIKSQDGIIEELYDYHFDCLVVGNIHDLK